MTAFEGECRNIIELREHLKLCFLIILTFFEILVWHMVESCWTEKQVISELHEACKMGLSCVLTAMFSQESVDQQEMPYGLLRCG